ncbi:hypothetical protein GE21DRAFT_1207383 [Neurospora crassa]|nr:hypothetical protein B21J21.30 [imported] - Neurospora crassa [Neurospora crassa]KHE84892.1 hypothetical protein GE21DRAFT_1207383 [Neurospora crassa]
MLSRHPSTPRQIVDVRRFRCRSYSHCWTPPAGTCYSSLYDVLSEASRIKWHHMSSLQNRKIQRKIDRLRTESEWHFLPFSNEDTSALLLRAARSIFFLFFSFLIFYSVQKSKIKIILQHLSARILVDFPSLAFSSLFFF